jgi:hypothetical protein
MALVWTPQDGWTTGKQHEENKTRRAECEHLITELRVELSFPWFGFPRECRYLLCVGCGERMLA